MKKITAQDIASAAGVSPSTVSRVLNNSGKVEEQTRQRILSIIRETGFPVFRRGENLTIAVIGSFQRGHIGGYFGLTAGAVCEEIFACGGHVELVPVQAVALLNERAVWGAVNLCDAGQYPPGFRYDNFGIPVVNINLPAIPSECVGAVIMKDDEPVREAVELLWSKGHRRIAYFSCESREAELHKVSRRWYGYMVAMRALGVSQPEKYVIFASYSNMEAGLRKLLNRGFTAVIFPYEIANLHLEPYLHQYKVRIPEDLSIVQWEYPLVSSVLSPPRSTICHDHQKAAKEAVSLLYDMILRKAPAREIFVPSAFLNRKSICDRTADRRAAVIEQGETGIQKRILSLLADHPMSPKELALSLGISPVNGNFRRCLNALSQKNLISAVDSPHSGHLQYRLRFPPEIRT